MFLIRCSDSIFSSTTRNFQNKFVDTPIPFRASNGMTIHGSLFLYGDLFIFTSFSFPCYENTPLDDLDAISRVLTRHSSLPENVLFLILPSGPHRDLQSQAQPLPRPPQHQLFDDFINFCLIPFNFSCTPCHGQIEERTLRISLVFSHYIRSNQVFLFFFHHIFTLL